MLSYVTLEQRVPKDHPLREIRRITDVVLKSLSGEFYSLYSASGRPSIAPEYVLRALLSQAFYSVRSERQLVEQIDYNLLFRWFVGLGMDDAVWNHAVFSKNRDRLLTSEVAQQFFAAVNEQAKRFMSDEHFTVDGTLIHAWASQKSFRKKDGSDGDGANFLRQQALQRNARVDHRPGRAAIQEELRQGVEAGLSGPYAGGEPQWPDRRRDGHPGRCYAERETALLLLKATQKGSSRRITVGADKAYDTKDFVTAARALNVTAHVSKNEKEAARTWIAEPPGISATRSA